MSVAPIHLVEAFESFTAPVKHLVYDLTIKDLQERKRKVLKFDNAKEAACYLGVIPKTVFNNRTPGTNIKSPLLKKEFAVRWVNPNISNHV